MKKYLVTGKTYDHKDALRKMGGKWSPELNGWIVTCGSNRLMHVLTFTSITEPTIKAAQYNEIYNEGANMTRKYIVEIGGAQMSTYEDVVYTLSAAKQMAADNSNANWCNVYRNDVLVSAYRRDNNGNGNRWYKAQI